MKSLAWKIALGTLLMVMLLAGRPVLAAEINLYQENDPAVIYTGSWGQSWPGNASGGYVQVSNTTDSTVTFNIYGTGFKWIGGVTPNSGKAEVSVDGNIELVADLYNPQYLQQKIIFEKNHLDLGNHTVRIRVTGDHNAVSSGYEISVDAFEVTNSSDNTAPLTPATPQAASSANAVDLSWPANSDGDLEGYNIYRSTSPNTGLQKINRWPVTGSTSFKDDAVIIGTNYYYRVTALDLYGNESAPSPAIAALPALYQGWYEEDDPGVEKKGTWHGWSPSQASGGFVRYSSTAGDTINLTIYGTGFKWIGNVNPYNGLAEIKIDGNPELIADLYSPQYYYQQIIFEKSHLDRGVHQIEIRVTGNRNPAAADAQVHFDAVQVIDSSDLMPPAAPKITQAINSSKLVELFWPAVTDNDLEGYNVYRSTTADSGFTKINQWLVTGGTGYKDGTVANGITYYYRVTAVDYYGNESPLSLAVDALPAMYRGSYEEDSTGVDKQGTWNAWGPWDTSGHFARYNNTTGDSVTMNIYGNSFKWITAKAYWGGIAQVKIDEGQPGAETRYVDLYNNGDLWQQNVLEKTWPQEGLHTVTISAYGQKNANSSGYYIFIDRFEVGGSAEERARVEETSPTLDYTKSWDVWSNNGSSGNQVWGVRKTGAAVSYTFYGTGVEWLAQSDTNRGYAKVTLDNEAPVIVDLYYPWEYKQNRVFKRHNLPLGQHTIRIEALGTKSATASDTWISLDSFEVLSPAKNTPTVPGSVYATAGPTSIALSWNSAGPEVVGYRVYRYRGILDDGLITSNLVRGESFTDSRLAPGVEYTYRISAMGTLGNESALSAAVYGTPAVPGSGQPVPQGITTLTAGVYQENDSRIIYTGNWWGSGEWPASGSYLLYGNGESTKATVYFEGTGIKWQARRYWNSWGSGTAEVWIDGSLAGKVNLDGPDEYQQVVFQQTHLARGFHKAEIRSTDVGIINIDLIKILDNGDITPPAAPLGLATVKGNTTVDLSWTTSPETDLDGYRLYRSTTLDSGFTPLTTNALKMLRGVASYHDTRLLNGTRYYYALTAVDQNGNESAVSGVVYAKPAAGIGGHQDEDGGIVYTGSWWPSGEWPASGSRLTITNTTGSSASLTFEGTGIRWVSKTSNYGGVAEVILKDEWGNILKDDRVDLYSGTDVYQFEAKRYLRLPLGIYTIEIKNTDAKNPSSSGYYIPVDFFEVLYSDDLTPSAVPQNLQAVAGSKRVELQWGAVTDKALDGYLVYRATDSNGPFVQVNPNTVTGKSAWVDNTVNGVVYYYKVTALDQAGNESDFSNMATALPAMYRGSYEEDSTGVNKQGTWNAWGPWDTSGHFARYNNTTGDSVTMNIYGNSFKWITAKAYWGGIAQVKIDEGQPGAETRYVDLYNNGDLWQQNVLEKTWPQEGLHTVTISAYGQKNANSSGYYIFIDRFEVGGSAEERARVEETSPTLDYTKSWDVWSNNGSSGNQVWGVRKTGAAVSYTFYGTGVEWLAQSDTNRGYAKVTLDNEAPVIVDLYYPWEYKQNRVFKRHNLPLGQHTIRIEALGTKSATASDTWISLDSFEVLSPAKNTPTVPGSVYATAGPTSIALSWNSAGPEVVGYRVYRYRGILDDGLITSNLVRGESFTDSRLAPGVEYTYRISAMGTLGNESALSAAVYGTPAVPGSGQPVPQGITTLTAGVYQENDSRIIYTGNWWGSGEWPASGSYLLYGNGESTKATVYFEGTGIKWQARRYWNSWGSGTAEVWIDGSLAGKVNLDGPDEYQQVVFQQTQLAQGFHKAEIRATDVGTINIDLIQILDNTEITPPAAPLGLATVKGNTTVDLSWTASPETDLDGYRLYRSTIPDGGFKPLTTNALQMLRGVASYQDTGLLNGTRYYYTLTAVDQNDNESPVSAVVYAKPAAGTGIHQDEDGGIVYTGNWWPSGEGLASGSRLTNNNTTGSSAALTFEGTGIRWVSKTNYYGGIAEIILKDEQGNVLRDDKVDLYSGTDVYQFEAKRYLRLPLGIYTIEIKNTDAKNPSSSGYYIPVDFFEVLYSDDLTPSAVPQNLQAVAGSKRVELQWGAVTDKALDGYLVYRATDSNGPFVQVNPNTVTGKSAWVDNTVNGVVYYYKVTALDQAGNESDFSNMATALPAMYRGSYEEDSTGVNKQGTWNAWGPWDTSGHFARYNNTTGDSVTMNIYGNSFKWITAKAYWGGIAQVKIDEGQPGAETRYVDLYNNGDLWQQNVLEKTWPQEGLHTVTISAYGQKNANSSGYYIFIDRFEVGGSAEERARVEESSPTLDYTKSWDIWSNSGSSGNQVWAVRKPGAKVSYTFYGTGIEWLAHSDPNRGYAKVTLDNEAPVIVDLYYPGEYKQNRVFKRYNLPVGKHTIRIEALGTKTATASDTWISLDAFEVLSPAKETPAVPESVYAIAGPTSVDLRWNSAGPEVVGYRVHRYRGILDDGLITPNLVRSESYTDSRLTPGVEYTYRISAMGTLGNESALSAAVYGTPSVPGDGQPVPEGITTLTAGVYQDNDSRIIYTGNWWGSGDWQASEGYMHYGSGETTTATVYFEGTGIKWLARRYWSSWGSGAAEVWVDGSLAGKVNLEGPDEYQQVVFQQTHLAPGFHKMDIRATDVGTINIDLIEILDNGEIDPPAAPLGLTTAKGSTTVDLSWTASPETDLDGYRLYRSTIPDSGFTPLTTNALKMLRRVASYHDTELLNGVRYYYALTAIDQNGNESPVSDVVYAKPAAGLGIHQDNDPGIAYSGNWWNNGSWQASGGQFYRANSIDSSASLVFEGTGIRWISWLNYYGGKAEVYLDGQDEGTVDLYRPNDEVQNIIWQKTNLPYGYHTLTIQNTVYKNPASNGNELSLDALEVLGDTDLEAPGTPLNLKVLSDANNNFLQWTWGQESDLYGYHVYRSNSGDEGTFTRLTIDPLRYGSTYTDSSITGAVYYRVSALDQLGNESQPSLTFSPLLAVTPNALMEEDNQALTFTGVWNRGVNSSANGGFKYSTDQGLGVSYTWYGTGIDWLADVHSDRAVALVTIDDGNPVRVDLFARSNQAQVPVYRVRGLEQKLHTLKISFAGRNINSTSDYITVDAFRIVDADLAAPNPPINVQADALVNKVLLTWNPPADPDIIGYKVFERHGIYDYSLASQAGLTQSGFRHTGLNLSTVYYYVVKAVDALGNESTVSAEVYAETSESYIKAILPPNYQVLQGRPLTMNAGSSYTADPPLAYAWDLDGDGQYDDGTGAAATYTFMNYGPQTVGLQVADSANRTDTTTAAVYVTKDDVPPTVAVNPPGGLYNVAKNVTLTASETGTIYYTTDSSDPTALSNRYSNPVPVTGDLTVKYVAYDVVGNQSPIYTAQYWIDTVAPDVYATPAGGDYHGTLSVTLVAYEPATIFYTTNGSEPNANSTIYQGPLTLQTNTALKFAAVDEAGNWSPVQAENYVFDNAAPNVSVSPTGGLYKQSLTVTLAASEPGEVFYTTDGSDPQPGGNAYQGPLTVATDTTLKYLAVDDLGNFSPIQSQTYRFDYELPIILGIEPADSTVFGAQAQITARAEDNLGVAALTLQYSVDGGVYWTDVATINTNYSATFNWNTSALDGMIKVRVLAQDTAGNRSDGNPVRTYSVFVDHQGPAEVTNVSATAAITGITLHWSDVPDQDLAYFQVEVKSVDGKFHSIGTTSTTLGYNVTGLAPETNYTYRVVAYDQNGNRGTPSIEITAATLTDTVAPVMTGLGPAPAYFNNQIPLWSNVSDNVGVKTFNFQYSADQNTWYELATITPLNPPTVTSFTYTWDVRNLGEGSYYVRGVATDTYGNLSSSLSSYVEYKVDHTAPTAPNVTITPEVAYISLRWQQNQEFDLAYYRVYRAVYADGSYMMLSDRLLSLGYDDRSAEPNQNYYYKVTTVDQAGNEGETTASAAYQLVPDTEAPQILSFAPAANQTLPANPTLSVLVADNFRLAQVSVEYQVYGADPANWTVVGSKTLNGNSDVASFTWNTAGLTDDHYLVRAQATDLAGNQTISNEVYYGLNVEPPAVPELTATPGGWRVDLNWTNSSDPDLAGYRVLRGSTPGGPYQAIKQTTVNSFSDEKLTPGTYYYMVEAWDIYRNASRSVEVAAYSTTADPYPPTAEAGDRQMATIGSAVYFDGLLSRDNDRIASYIWNFGDGTTGEGAQPGHAYLTEGSYTVTLAVYDPYGNQAIDTTTVDVRPPQLVGTLEIRVLDDVSGVGLANASIVIQFPDGSTQKIYSDNQGVAQVTAGPGDYKVYAYKTDYKPQAATATVVLNQSTRATLRLPRGQLVIGELTVHRMNLQEIQDAGVDVSAPENQWVYKFEVHLAFNNQPLPSTQFVVNGAGNFLAGSWTPLVISGGGGGSAGNGGGSMIAYPVAIPHVGHPEVRPTIAYLVIPGEARWLKEFFEVSLLLENTADPEFVITNSRATLKLPDGLALAPTREQQTQTINIGELPGGETRQVKWIIRGDQKGYYTLEADFNGDLQPFNDPVMATFRSSDPFRVWGDDALRIRIDAQNRADQGYPYHVRFGLENLSDIPVYNAAIELKEDGKQNYIYGPNQQLSQMVTELPADETHWFNYWLIPAISGNLDLSQSYSLKTGVNDTTLPVVIASHPMPENIPGAAPVLYQNNNSDGTVSLKWDTVVGAAYYDIYQIRPDLRMSSLPEKVYGAVYGETELILPEIDGPRDYVMLTRTNGNEILRHAITGRSWGPASGATAITVDPIQLIAGQNNEILVTVNKSGFPVAGGSLTVVDYSYGNVLDNNGQVRLFIHPLAPGSITLSVYDAAYQYLASKTIIAVASPVTTPATTLYLEPKNTSVTVGGPATTFIVKVKEAKGLYGGDLELHFDQQVVAVVENSLTIGNVLYGLNIQSHTNYDNTNGLIKLSASRTGDNNGFNGDGVIMSFALRGLQPGVSTIDFAYTTLADGEAQPLEFTALGSSVQVQTGVTITGQVYLQGVTGYAGGVEVKLINAQHQIVATTQTDAYGYYHFEHDQNGQALPAVALAVYATRPVYLSRVAGLFTPLPGAATVVSLPELLTGDLDYDNNIGLADFIMLANVYGNHYSNNNPVNWSPEADLNRDNRISLIDLVLLAKNYGRSGSVNPVPIP